MRPFFLRNSCRFRLHLTNAPLAVTVRDFGPVEGLSGFDTFLSEDERLNLAISDLSPRALTHAGQTQSCLSRLARTLAVRLWSAEWRLSSPEASLASTNLLAG